MTGSRMALGVDREQVLGWRIPTLGQLLVSPSGLAQAKRIGIDLAIIACTPVEGPECWSWPRS